jgi:transcriptional regulator with XRE-family HTH domain
MQLHIKHIRSAGLPRDLIHDLVTARHARGWSQAELGRKVGLPQVHISAIETGKVVPRFNTLLDLVRVLDYDLLLVPRALVPAVQSLIREHRLAGTGAGAADAEERPLYALDEDTPGEADES